MKTRIGIFQLCLIFAGLVALFVLLIMWPWPNKASYFHDAPNHVVQRP